jgi:uncharacterized protein
VIAYFDTSALVPLVIRESGTDRAAQLWETADRVVTVQLAVVEARAALAQAARLNRLTASQLAAAKRALRRLFDQVDVISMDDTLLNQAGDIAERHALRAYDAVHLSAALRIHDDDVCLVAGDQALLDAAASAGLAFAALP